MRRLRPRSKRQRDLWTAGCHETQTEVSQAPAAEYEFDDHGGNDPDPTKRTGLLTGSLRGLGGGARLHCADLDLTLDEQRRLIDVLKAHEAIMISSGNALPPPAYGVVCDIDVSNHSPIKQRARRIPLRHLKKLYELLKGLLTAGLVAFSDSPWASPIVIVLKKMEWILDCVSITKW
ncbi:unnamed protein product [Phytophthora lilii]|uniref:Unnamed protein product n=1 Tax=Phytophthora lilii TaxID=2077276 RepID=A0A9W6TQ58_9STRA|nr:unnamed protein product [Phytophthora lilii]